MLPGVSKRQGVFVNKVRTVASKRRIRSVEGFVARLDDTGRMETILIGPGFDLHLRNVDALTLARDKTSGNFRFIVDTAERETVARGGNVGDQTW